MDSDFPGDLPKPALIPKNTFTFTASEAMKFTHMIHYSLNQGSQSQMTAEKTSTDE